MARNIANRVENMRKYMRESDLDAILVINVEGSDRHNLYYLTGFSGTFGFLILTLSEALFLTDSRYLAGAKRELESLEGIKVKEINRKWRDEFVQSLNKMDLDRIGINSKTTSVYNFNQTGSRLDSKTLIPLEGPVEKLRRIKDDQEVQSIHKAVELTDRAYDWLLKKIRPGMTEKEVAWELEKYMRENGAGGLAFSIIAASGANSALPHHTTSARKLATKDLLLLDFGALVDNYCADLTRVFAIGEATKKQREIYRTVLSAQKNALENIRSGMSGKQADRLARARIEEAGYGDNFGHGLGHGLGLEIHEAPRLSPDIDAQLEPGMVVTCEPGIYIPDWGGVRIEDLVIIEEDGCRNLTRSPKEELIVV